MVCSDNRISCCSGNSGANNNNNNNNTNTTTNIITNNNYSSVDPKYEIRVRGGRVGGLTGDERILVDLF